MYRVMIDSKRRSINKEDEEMDDELEMATVLLIGQYRKRIRMNHRGCIGSVIGHEVHNRQRQEYDLKLYQDYFSEHPTYPGKFFRRCFRMRCSLYLRIARAVEEHDNYFVQRRNAAGALGFSYLQKVTAAYRQLAYAVPADYVDEYVHIGESTSIECLRRFVRAVCEVFDPVSSILLHMTHTKLSHSKLVVTNTEVEITHSENWKIYLRQNCK
jgi:hypothetical protein